MMDHQRMRGFFINLFLCPKGGCQKLPVPARDGSPYTHSVKFTYYYSTLFSLEIVLQVWEKRERRTGNRFVRPSSPEVAVPWTCHAWYRGPDSVHHYYRKLYNFSIKETSCGYGVGSQNHKKREKIWRVTFLFSLSFAAFLITTLCFLSNLTQHEYKIKKGKKR